MLTPRGSISQNYQPTAPSGAQTDRDGRRPSFGQTSRGYQSRQRTPATPVESTGGNEVQESIKGVMAALPSRPEQQLDVGLEILRGEMQQNPNNPPRWTYLDHSEKQAALTVTLLLCCAWALLDCYVPQVLSNSVSSNLKLKTKRLG